MTIEAADSPEPTPAQVNASIDFAQAIFARVPKTDRVEFELHLTSVLIMFWGALWGTFGTEYAKGFIQSQLAGMEGEADLFMPPSAN